jgi:hypothetical protein
VTDPAHGHHPVNRVARPRTRHVRRIFFRRRRGRAVTAGRDRWPWAVSLALAGGGIAGDVCFCATNATAAHPTRDPHDPSDVVATVYHVLGVPPERILREPLGRPHALISGKPIGDLLA